MIGSLCSRTSLRHQSSRQESLSKRTPGNKTDPQFLAGWKHLWFRVFRPNRVLSPWGLNTITAYKYLLSNLHHIAREASISHRVPPSNVSIKIVLCPTKCVAAAYLFRSANTGAGASRECSSCEGVGSLAFMYIVRSPKKRAGQLAYRMLRRRFAPRIQ